MLKITKYILQYFIATLLLLTGIGKLLDIQGFAKVIETFQIFSGWITIPIGILMIITELFLSVWLFSGKQLKYAALASGALHVTFIFWLSIATIRGLDIPNCGCFGVFFARPLDWITIAEDSFMVAISLLLYFIVLKMHNNRL